MAEDHAKQLKEYKATFEENKKISFPKWWEDFIKSYKVKKSPRTFCEQLWEKYCNDLPPPKEQGG